MKDSNLKISKIMTILTPIVAIMVSMSFFTTLLFYRVMIVDNSLLNFIIIAGPIMMIGCPILLIFSVLIVFNDIVMYKVKLPDLCRSRFNLKFGVVLLVLNLLVVASFYFAPSVSYWSRGRSDMENRYNCYEENRSAGIHASDCISY